jgi:hypothetical protein
VDAPAKPRRTPHGLWAAGAVVLLLLIAWATPVRRPPSPAPEAPPPGSPPIPTGRAGRVVCGFCNGDGRIDATDRARQAPRLDVPEGPCAACAGKGGR